MIIGIDASPLIRSEYTGTEWYCYFILLSLSKLPDAEKHTWILYVPHEKFSQKLELPSNWKVKKLSWPLMSGWLRGRLTLEMLISPVDIFFAPANILPYFTPERTFTTIHDVGFVKNSELYSMKEYNTLITSFKRALKKAKTIITISQFSKQEIHSFHPNANVSITMLNRKESKNTKEILPQIFNKPYIVFLGRITPKKNLTLLLDAWINLKKDKKFTQYSCYVVGRIDSSNVSLLEKLSNQKKHDFYYVPWISEKYSYTLLKEASAFIFPTLYEGFGMPLLEAQDAQVPVVCSNISVNHEIAGKGAVYFDLQNPIDLTDKIRAVLTDSHLRNSIIEAGNSNLKRYSWNKTAELTINILLS